MVYNYKYEVNYKNDDITVFQTCLLNVFNMEEYSLKLINKRINELFNKIKDEDFFIVIIKNLINFNKYIQTDYEYGLMLLFSFDLFEDFHKCLQDYFVNGTVKNELIQKTINIIKSDII